MDILKICPPHQSYVATLPWEIHKGGRFLGHRADS